MLIHYLTILLSFVPFLLFAQDTRDSLRMYETPPPKGLIENMVIEEEVVQEFAPDFEMLLEDGNTKRLSDFKGEVVYLSFWASWCGPCINGFNNYRELRDEMEDLGIVMLNVSIDKSLEKWEAAIKEHDPTGIHASVSHDDVKDAYQMYNVPRYEIVGKRGEFLYLSDEPGRDILANFKAFLDAQ